MELKNDFRVGVGVADAWKVLTDVERMAPLLPGAQLQEIEGDEYRGIVKVKVGPITAQYKGKATFAEKDERAGKLVLRCKGRDTRGQGNASARITVKLASEGASSTKVNVDTDLTVTGKVAQFGRGVMADVSTKLIRQFVDNLEADIAKHRPGSQHGTTAAGSSTSTSASAGAASAAAATSASSDVGEKATSSGAGDSAYAGESAPASGAARKTSTEGAGETASGSDAARKTSAAGAGESGTASAGESGTGSAGESGKGSAGESGTGSAGESGTSASAGSPTGTSASAGSETGSGVPQGNGSKSGATETGASHAKLRVVDQAEPEPVDIFDAAGASVAKRLAPALGGIGLLAVVFRMLRRRRS